MEKDRISTPSGGYAGVAVSLLLFAGAIVLLTMFNHTLAGILGGIICLVLSCFIVPGFLVLNPNEASVLILFGAYKGTIKSNGFYWINPFFVKKRVSLRARNLTSDALKVNDKLGNPIMIGIVLVWKVEDTYKAAFAVDDYANFVQIQSESAVRKLAGHYAYDNFDDEQTEITLRSGGEEVNHVLEKELSERLQIAGIKVIEARIAHLAYSPEIAGAMLRRQQATAVVAARTKIVEGAVSMVKLALNKLAENQIVELDEERKATMVSNLMVVLCSDKDATPVVNAGTLYQ
ncbi:MAG TPA: SPFH domain-containing protein [Bacteroidales bacterium]|nr:SPFH domain-containing protein [Paludibacteraceae bacterium]HPT02074.1 SPFH domain-containing protein [Bacteroidales bacterium]